MALLIALLFPATVDFSKLTKVKFRTSGGVCFDIKCDGTREHVFRGKKPMVVFITA
jgi:hypothetical protein